MLLPNLEVALENRGTGEPSVKAAPVVPPRDLPRELNKCNFLFSFLLSQGLLQLRLAPKLTLQERVTLSF